MRRSVKWSIAVAAIVAIGAGFCRWPIASARVGVELNRVMPPIGLHWRGPARAYFALLPWPTLRVIGVDLFAADGHSVLTAPSARFPLSLAALTRGRFAPTGATLESPTALIDLDAAPALAEERVVAEDSGAGLSAWGRVRLLGGVMHVVSASRHIDTLIEGLDGGLDWPQADSPLRASVAGSWRGERVAIRGRVDNLGQALRRRAAKVALTIESRPLALSVDGAWDGSGEPSFVGTLDADIRSLAALKRLLDVEDAPFPLGDAFSMSGKAQVSGQTMTLSDATVTASGQKLEGALSIARSAERYAVSGSLAADQLDLLTLIKPPPELLSPTGEWSQTPFAFSPPADVDLDLRLSAARLQWGPHAIADAAGALMCKLGSCVATLLEANAYQGALKGELTVARGARGLTTVAKLSLVGADLGAICTEFGRSAFHGIGDVEATLRSTGFAPSDSILSLAGEASATVRSGAIDGFSIEDAIRHSQRRPGDIARDFVDGVTHFSEARLRLAIADGVATIGEGRVEGPGTAIDLGGMIDFAQRSWQAQARATQADTEGAPSPDAARLTIVLSGPWSAPNVSAAPGD